MVKFNKIFIFLAVLSLGFEIDIFSLGGSGIKLWMLAALVGGLMLLWDLYRKGFGWLKKSKLFWLGLGFILFSALGLLNSPLPGYSLKQLIVLTAIIALGFFFETNLREYRREVYAGLTIGILINSLYAIYQNVAFNLGWPNFEVMAARPNGFFPEPDWLGVYLALGMIPFLVAVAKDKRQKLPRILQKYPPLYIFLLLGMTALTITVARASWLAVIAEMGVIGLIFLYRKGFMPTLKIGGVFLSLIVLPLILISVLHLSRFNIPDRFRSIFLKEHIITEAVNPNTGEKFKINLEEKGAYRNQGYQIVEEYTGDENVASREEKAASTWDIIRQHVLVGSGLGITLINTNYQHNANNLFLEWWASAGLGGLLLIVGLILYLLYQGGLLIKSDSRKAALILAGTIGFVIVNLFNASIFLAFAWFYLAWLLTTTR